MPRQLREWPAYNELKKEIEDRWAEELGFLRRPTKAQLVQAAISAV